MDNGMKITAVVMGQLSENCYLLEDSKSGDLAVIDPGLFNQDLKKRISNPGKVKYILLTHRHFDHVTGAGPLKEYTGAKIVIHAEDECGLTNPTSAFGFFGNKPKATKADWLIKDGDEIKLGELTIRVLHTPGHSRGSVCYIVNDVIFSGDTLFFRDIGRLDLPSGNYKDMIASLQKLAELPADYKVYPGHGQSTTLAFERENNPYMGKTEYDDFTY